MTAGAAFSGSEPLAEGHDVSGFNCGKHPSLNDWLKRYVLISQKSESARTYVVCRNTVVAGYYSLAAGILLDISFPTRSP
jgi:hypothetical protein